MQRLKIGIVGCGVIGSGLARAIEEKFGEHSELVALCDIDEHKAEELRDSLLIKPALLSMEQLIRESDLIIEAASSSLAGEIARKTILSKKDIMVMSIGGLLKAPEIFDLANKRDVRIYLPSGALCGIDGVKSAASGRISKAVLTTRKPPRGLEGAPYLVKNNIDLSRIKEETVIFEGTALEAVSAFPKNINVSATLSLAGIGPEKTRVRIITSPRYTANIHEIELEGDFGKLITRTENVPSPQNPKTSFLALLSAVATLKGILESVKIGT